MGGIIAPQTTSSSFPFASTLLKTATKNLLPKSYYSLEENGSEGQQEILLNNLSQEEINICQTLWIQIIDDTNHPPEESSFTSQENNNINNTLRSWFYHQLFHQFSSNQQQSPLNPLQVHIFLQSILQLIPISFYQFTNPTHFSEHFQYFAKRCTQIGMTTTHFINFGHHLFSTIQVINPNLNVIISWKKLYSSILFVVIPVVVMSPPSRDLTFSVGFHHDSSTTIPVTAAASATAPIPHFTPAPVIVPMLPTVQGVGDEYDDDYSSQSMTLNPYGSPFQNFHLSNPSSDISRRCYTAMENILF